MRSLPLLRVVVELGWHGMGFTASELDPLIKLSTYVITYKQVRPLDLI